MTSDSAAWIKTFGFIVMSLFIVVIVEALIAGFTGKEADVDIRDTFDLVAIYALYFALRGQD